LPLGVHCKRFRQVGTRPIHSGQARHLLRGYSEVRTHRIGTNSHKVIELDVFVSCGSEVEALRDVAGRVLRAVERAFYKGLDIPVVVRIGDYRYWSPEVVPSGQFAAPSLAQVDKSSAVVGILGATVPTVTSKELIHAIGRYADGRSDHVWLFVAAATKADVHHRFLKRVKRATKMIVLYQEFDDPADLQEKLFVALIPYVVKKSILERQTPVETAIGAIA
jgi:hypothetical protein